ncbi:MAG: site-specific DNA-methyltransferase [Ignavibacteriales bacterium]|nr:site-specific DNA-methyltransferase [Ignavibacteriales bacterium]
MELNKIICGDTLETVKTFSDESIDCVITSPPYWQLRDYGWTGQWGLEKTYQEYLDKMIVLMAELKRVLKPTGTMWINLGDSYNGNKEGSTHQISVKKDLNENQSGLSKKCQNNIPNKSLILIPHRFAIRCVDELGLILRNDIIWAKRNGMPESVTDRFSKKHEFFFFFVKNQKYYFDLDGVRCEYSEAGKQRSKYLFGGNKGGLDRIQSGAPMGDKSHLIENGKNPGDISDFWDVPTQPSSDKHYATYNFDLIDKPIVCGCPEGGVILDPFCGTGTTLLRAEQLNRKSIGIDGSKEYCEIAGKRLENFRKQLKLF